MTNLRNRYYRVKAYPQKPTEHGRTITQGNITKALAAIKEHGTDNAFIEQMERGEQGDRLVGRFIAKDIDPLFERNVISIDDIVVMEDPNTNDWLIYNNLTNKYIVHCDSLEEVEDIIENGCPLFEQMNITIL